MHARVRAMDGHRIKIYLWLAIWYFFVWHKKLLLVTYRDNERVCGYIKNDRSLWFRGGEYFNTPVENFLTFSDNYFVVDMDHYKDSV